MTIHTCLRCKYQWVGRKEGRPFSCPRCRSFSWDIEPPKGYHQYQRNGKPGRPSRYQIADLEPGETRVFQYDLLPDGSKDHVGMRKLNNALNSQVRKSGIIYYRTLTFEGMVVTRKK